MTRSFLLKIAALISATLFLSSAAEGAENPKPFVIPELKEWSGKTGDFMLTGGSGLKDKIMRIGGNGNVRVERAGKILTGDSAEFFPGEERFFVRENVRLTDAAGTLSVSGDVAEGKVDARVVEIVATKPRAELRGEGAPVAVSVRMPSMLGKDGNAAARGSDAPPARRADGAPGYWQVVSAVVLPPL